MARAVIGGLSVASFLTLFVIPVLYLTFEQKVLKRAERKHPKEKPVPYNRPSDLNLSQIA
jgi:hypothetical protein